MIITSLNNSYDLAKRLASKLKAKYSPLTISTFPDGDIYLKFNSKIKGQKLVIVESFQPNPNQALLNIIFAAETAKNLGAKKVILVAPYLAYMRQDKRFNPGEAINSRIMAKHLNTCINKIITFDPHLHRYKSLKDIFTVSAKRITANKLIGDYVKKNIKNPVIIGPDSESYQWAHVVAKIVGSEVSCFEKKRHSSRHVTERMIKQVVIKNKNVVIVDDIISTGHTIIEAAKKVRKLGAKSVTDIGVHGLLDEGDKKLRKHVNRIVTTNTIKHKTNKIDILPLLVKELK